MNTQRKPNSDALSTTTAVIQSSAEFHRERLLSAIADFHQEAGAGTYIEAINYLFREWLQSEDFTSSSEEFRSTQVHYILSLTNHITKIQEQYAKYNYSQQKLNATSHGE